MATVGAAAMSTVPAGYGIKANGFGYASDAQAVRIKDARRIWRASNSRDTNLTALKQFVNFFADT